MQIISDTLAEESPKHTSNQSSNNNSIPSSLGVDAVDHVPQNVVKRHSFTTAVPKPAATAPLLSTPENRSVSLNYSNGGNLKNGRKRTIQDQVIVLENLNLDSITQSTSTAPIFTNKPISPRKINMPTANKPIFNKAPLQVNVDRPLQTNNSEPFSSDSYLSQQQECSSNHSDENPILSPIEATECMLRTIYGVDTKKSSSWSSWDGPESKSPRTEIKEEKPISFNESGQTNPSSQNGEVTSTQTSAIDPHDINLNENEFEPKKPTKAAATKDPESGLTIDTVKRRRLCARYDHLLAEHGIVHRLAEVPNLTNIQVAGLLRRSRNRQEMADLSEDVWNFVFEEKRRVEDRSFSENIITSKEFTKKLSNMKADDIDEATDTSDIEDYNPDFENGFLFEEVQNLEEEDCNVHELLASECEFYEIRRCYYEMDKWLCLLKRSLMERRSNARKIVEMITKRSTLQFTVPAFSENEDSTQRCARCMPVKILNRPKIVKQEPIARKNDVLNFVKQSDQLSNLDDDLSRCLEDLSLQLEHEDFSVLAGFSRPTMHLEPRIVIENISEIRRREARDRAKKASERLKQTARGVGRPPKDRRISKSEANRKHLKRKASRDHRERLNSNEVTILQENPAELKSFEEQLRRLSNSKAYVYSEIIVPEYRLFDLNAYIEKASDKLVRKVSNDLIENHAEVAGTSHEAEDVHDPLFFAKIHHECEYPVLTEEEIRRRRKERWPIPVYLPFDASKYEHEDSRKVALMYCMINDKSPPFPPRFHPGIVTQPCIDVHREPKVQTFNKCYRKPPPTPGSVHSQDNNP